MKTFTIVLLQELLTSECKTAFLADLSRLVFGQN